MVKYGFLARFDAKPGRENDLEIFLKQALTLAREEDQMVAWYAFRIDLLRFGIFDTFQTEADRAAHMSEKIATALLNAADDLLAGPPLIEKIDILAVKETNR